MRGAVEVSRDDLDSPGAQTPPRLLEVDPDAPLRGLVTGLARWLPWPDGTACWVVTVREPGDRWSWSEWTLAVVHRDRVVMRDDAGSGRRLGHTGWQARLHAAHRSTAAPAATDGQLLARSRDSRTEPQPVAVEVVRHDVHAGDTLGLERRLEVGPYLPVRTLVAQLAAWVPWPQRSQGWVVRVAGASWWAGHVLAVVHLDRTALRGAGEGVRVGRLADAVGRPVRLSLEHRSSAAPPRTDAELLG